MPKRLDENRTEIENIINEIDRAKALSDHALWLIFSRNIQTNALCAWADYEKTSRMPRHIPGAIFE